MPNEKDELQEQHEPLKNNDKPLEQTGSGSTFSGNKSQETDRGGNSEENGKQEDTLGVP